MRKKFLIILGFITVIGLIIRLQVGNELIKLDSQVSNPSNVTDMFTYKDLSEKILKGEFKQVFYYQPFYYAVFLPALKFCFGKGIWPIVIAQSFLSALTIWLSGLSGALLRSRKVGILTGLFVAFSTVLILYTPYYIIATLQAFWISLIFYLCIKYLSIFRNCADEKYILRLCSATGIGLLVGISILTRGNIWFFVPGILFVLLLVESKNKIIYKKILIIIMFLFFLVLPQIPFSYHNSKIKGQFTGPSTAAGAVLSLGNTPESPPGGRDPGSGPGAMEYPETCKYWGGQADNTPVYIQMMEWFYREPLAFLELQFRKSLLFWDYREIPNNIAIEYNGLKSNILRWVGFISVKTIKTPMGDRSYIPYDFIPMSLLVLGFGLAGALSSFVRFFSKGLKGIYKNIKIRTAQYLLLYFVIAYWLGTAVFYILGRFRAPLIPLLALFASLFVCQLFSFIKKNRHRKIVIQHLLIFIISFAVVLFGFSIYRYGFESNIMNIIRADGVQVELGKGNLMIRDNGPVSFGSWIVNPLKYGRKIKKKFIIPEIQSKDYSVTFKIDCYWQIPGSAVLNINGQKFRISNNQPGPKSHEFILNDISNGEVVMVPLKVNPGLFCFTDMQRNYGRTIINHENPGGEFVCSLYIRDNK